MTGKTLAKRIEAESIELVRAIYIGPDGITRGKAFRPQFLDEVLDSGIGLTRAQASVTPFDQLPTQSQFQPVGEVRIRPDTKTFVPLPYLPGHARMLADLETTDGKPWELCPRSLLRKAVAELEQRGLTLRAAFENEFTLYKKDGESLVPLDELNCFSSAAMDIASPYILPMIKALEAQGVVVEKYFPEAGAGQQEIPVKHREGVAAADQQVVFKETIRGVALAENVAVTFMPKPDPQSAGNGCHVHLSLWDDEGKQNLFYDAAGEFGLSTLARQFLAGVLEHTESILAFTAPTTNSYQRFVERCWSSCYVCWGPDNREATVRASSGFAGREKQTVNLEFKPCDPTCNPYLALAALIYAGLDGIDRQLSPPAPTLTDPALISKTKRKADGLRRYPTDLAGSIAALKGNSYFREKMGCCRIDDYIIAKEAEIQAIEAMSPEAQKKAYFFRY